MRQLASQADSCCYKSTAIRVRFHQLYGTSYFFVRITPAGHYTGGPAKYLPHGQKLGTPSTLVIQTHQQTGKTPYLLQSPLLEVGLYLYNTRFTKVDGVPSYVSEKSFFYSSIQAQRVGVIERPV